MMSTNLPVLEFTSFTKLGGATDKGRGERALFDMKDEPLERTSSINYYATYLDLSTLLLTSPRFI